MSHLETKINDLIQNMNYKQRCEALRILSTEEKSTQKDAYLDEMRQHESFVGKTYKSRTEDKFYRFLSARSKTSRYMEAFVFSLPLSVNERSRHTLMFRADSAFSTIDYEEPHIESVPIFENGRLWFMTHEEIPEDEYFEKLREYFAALERAVKEGAFDTGAKFLAIEAPAVTEAPQPSPSPENTADILATYPSIEAMLNTLTPDEKNALQNALAVCTEQERYDKAVRAIAEHSALVGKCYKKNDAYFYLVSARSMNEYWMEALTFAFPVRIEENRKISLFESASSVFGTLDCTSVHVDSVPVYTMKGQWLESHEEILQEEFFEALRAFGRQMEEKIRSGELDLYIED